jgi:hypothetical protein
VADDTPGGAQQGPPGGGPAPDQPGWAAPRPPEPSPPPAPYQAAPAPAAAPPRKRRSLAWLGILLAVLAVFVASIVVIVVLAITRIAPPIQATNDYLQDIANGDYTSAHDRLCAAQRATVSEATLAREWQSFQSTFGSTEDLNVSPDDISRATPSTRVDVPGENRDLHFEVRKEDGHWKICTPFGNPG